MRLKFCFRLMSDKNELQEYVQFHGSCDVHQRALLVEDDSRVASTPLSPHPPILRISDLGKLPQISGVGANPHGQPQGIHERLRSSASGQRWQ